MKFNTGPLESDVETYLRNEIEKIGGKAYKWVSPGNPGVPDRIVIFKGVVYFVEMKRASGKLRLKQERVKEVLESLGANYRVISSKEEVREFVGGL